jgi:uncharacterized integral membrane protein
VWGISPNGKEAIPVFTSIKLYLDVEEGMVERKRLKGLWVLIMLQAMLKLLLGIYVWH